MAKPKSASPLVTEITNWKRSMHNFVDETAAQMAFELGAVGREGLDEKPIAFTTIYPLMLNYKLGIAMELFNDVPAEREPDESADPVVAPTRAD